MSIIVTTTLFPSYRDRGGGGEALHFQIDRQAVGCGVIAAEAKREYTRVLREAIEHVQKLVVDITDIGLSYVFRSPRQELCCLFF